MGPSTYLEQILYYDQCSVTDETFEKSAYAIFEKVEAKPSIQIWVQTHDSNSSSAAYIYVQKGPIELNVEAASCPSPPVDHCRFPAWEPPHYVGSHGLHRQYVSNSHELQNIVSVRYMLKYEYFKSKTDSFDYRDIILLLQDLVCKTSSFEVLSQLKPLTALYPSDTHTVVLI